MRSNDAVLHGEHRALTPQLLAEVAAAQLHLDVPSAIVERAEQQIVAFAQKANRPAVLPVLLITRVQKLRSTFILAHSHTPVGHCNKNHTVVAEMVQEAAIRFRDVVDRRARGDSVPGQAELVGAPVAEGSGSIARPP